jgi:hypothetical protein
MGLDAYITSYEKAEIDSKGQLLNQEVEQEELGYFRKVNWLQHWMQQNYATETGITDPDEFNCVHVVLTRERLLDLQADILDGNLQVTTGFFFGQQEIYPEQKQYVLEVIAKALFEVSQGKICSYSSWW